MSTVNLLIIATGKYERFLLALLTSANEYFCRDHDVRIHVWSDGVIPKLPRVYPHYLAHEEWPNSSAHRWRAILAEQEVLSQAQYTFHLDADLLFVEPVDSEIFSTLVATIHPGFIDGVPLQFPYERRIESSAHIPNGAGKRYYHSNPAGGETNYILAAFAEMDAAMREDERRGIVAYASDESYWNRYLLQHPPTLELSPDYCCTLEARDKRWWHTRRITHLPKDQRQLANIKPRVLIVNDVPDWAFEHVARQIERAFSDQYEFNIINYYDKPRWDTVDVVLWMWWKTAFLFRNRVQAKRVCAGIYDQYTVAADPNTFSLAIPLIDCWFAGNEAIADDMRKRAPGMQVELVEDGVDMSLFTPQPFPREFTVGWTGNNVYEQCGRGDLKGVRLIQAACERLGVPLVIQDKEQEQIPHVEMPERFYRRISCYVCASRCEGTPNPVLEALACGRPVVTTDVGIVRKLITSDAHGYIIERSVDAIADGIMRVKESSNQPITLPAYWDWKEKVKAFASVLGGPSAYVKIDLTADVTVFVLTVGDKENYQHCRDALYEQDCTFRLEVIDHIAPVSAAFQRMTDRCYTPFFIEVDEDMILKPAAVRMLHEAIAASPNTTALICEPLWDEHLQRALLGVKIYRHSALAKFQYEDAYHLGCDISMNERLRASGYTISIDWDGVDDKARCFGYHGMHYTPATAYMAYYNRALTSRLYPQQLLWLQELPKYFRDRLQAEPNNPIHLFSLLGYVAGLNVTLDTEHCGKDYRMVDAALTCIIEELA
jgi:histo-blood group ABO system transferase